MFSPGLLVAHCLLIETESDLVLVDTGMGLVDMKPRHTLGRHFEATLRPTLDPEETAIRWSASAFALVTCATSSARTTTLSWRTSRQRTRSAEAPRR